MANQTKTLTAAQKKDGTTIIKGLDTTSSQIRALDAAGWSRGDIARLLNKRYQHVRNVLTTPLKG